MWLRMWSWRRRHSETSMIAGVAGMGYGEAVGWSKGVPAIWEGRWRSVWKTHRCVVGLNADSAPFSICRGLWSSWRRGSLEAWRRKASLDWVSVLVNAPVSDTRRAIGTGTAQSADKAGSIRS